MFHSLHSLVRRFEDSLDQNLQCALDAINTVGSRKKKRKPLTNYTNDVQFITKKNLKRVVAAVQDNKNTKVHPDVFGLLLAFLGMWVRLKLAKEFPAKTAGCVRGYLGGALR